ncbi:hypothetical protein [Paeniglutamicibacter cryotolerans]|uniref:Uncharacterized protein n=1 Tax=Paeniglutamicibacter cryotolerans TaxID=670079 RepID=A0A839QFF2_9MICC|nr:hypothetical protein [Paeniglutamicibacter cryotolerans]MBB2994630.1 hypothetical protein [Paeniglutamicibacter cryotolerans]
MSPSIPEREPRLDTRASERAAVPREELSGLGIRQPYRSAGPWLSPDALAMLGLLGPRASVGVSADGTSLVSRRGGLGVFEKRGTAPALEELVAADLASRDGKLSGAGLLCTGPLRDTASAWRVMTRLGGRESLLQLWIGTAGDALVLAGPSWHQQILADRTQGPFSGHSQIDYLVAGEAAGVVTSWLGIGPSWFCREPAFSIDRRLYDARLAGDQGHPGTPPGPPELWEHQWLAWQIEDQRGLSSTFLNAGPAGHFTVQANAGAAVLERVPARNVYRQLAMLLADGKSRLR